VNVSPAQSGSVKVNGTSASSYPVTYSYAGSTSVTIEAVPAASYQFAYWAGCIGGSTNPVSLTVDSTRSVTAFFSPLPTVRGRVEGFVWEDANKDGIRDENESGIDAVSVKLFQANGTLSASTFTTSGEYLFTGVVPDSYYLSFDAPSSYVFSPKDQGGNDTKDSDAGANGRSEIFAVSPDGDAPVLDAGMFFHNSRHHNLAVEEADNLITADWDLIIIDVREESEYCGPGGHLPCARNYAWNSGGFETKIGELPLEATILLVCGSGYRSAKAAQFLDSRGFTAVYNLVGGMSGWQGEVQTCAEPCPALLFFPLVKAANGWETEIGIINPSPDRELAGAFKAYSPEGGAAPSLVTWNLPAHSRKVLQVNTAFTDSQAIGSIVFRPKGEAIGYSKSFLSGRYGTALPALSSPDDRVLHLAHIASGADWGTEITLLNTTSLPKPVSIDFNNGDRAHLVLAAHERRSVNPDDLAATSRQGGAQSASITHEGGIVGFELLTSSTKVSALPLSGDTSSPLYYPHIPRDHPWSTGLVVYNPSSSVSAFTFVPYGSDGSSLDAATLSLAPHTRYADMLTTLLPSSPSWLKIEADTTLSGWAGIFHADPPQLAAYASTAPPAKEGVFPEVTSARFTGLVLVNPQDAVATVTLTAYNESGQSLAPEHMTLGAHAKIAAAAQDLFTQDLAGATYLAYSSDQALLGLQFSFLDDGMLLDCLPGMESLAASTRRPKR
jgi:rhodanese-related sulfurtransferase